MTELEKEVAKLRAKVTALEERVRLDAVAEMFLAGCHDVREGDYFILYEGRPTRLDSVSSDGKWTYYNGRNGVEPFEIPAPDQYDRLYTIAEVAEIVAKARGFKITLIPVDTPAGRIEVPWFDVPPPAAPVDHIDARDAEWQKRLAPLHEGFTGDGCESGDPIDWTLSALYQRNNERADAYDELRDLVADAAPYIAAARAAAATGSNAKRDTIGWLRRASEAIGAAEEAENGADDVEDGS